MDLRKIVTALCVLTLGLAGSIRAAEPTGFELLNQKMLGMQNHITNASVKFKNNVGGIREAGRPAEAVSPARSCCSSNLAVIGSHMQALKALFEQWTADYAKMSDYAGVQALDRMKADLQQLAGALSAFEHAQDRATAEGSFRAVTQSFNRFRDGAEALQACCALPAPQEPSSPWDKPSKQKSQKKSLE